MKEEDPIEELHRIRRKIYKDAGGTPESLVRYYMKQQKQYGDRLVDLSRSETTQPKSRKRPTKPVAKATARKPNVRHKVVVS